MRKGGHIKVAPKRSIVPAARKSSSTSLSTERSSRQRRRRRQPWRSPERTRLPLSAAPIAQHHARSGSAMAEFDSLTDSDGEDASFAQGEGPSRPCSSLALGPRQEEAIEGGAADRSPSASAPALDSLAGAPSSVLSNMTETTEDYAPGSPEFFTRHTHVPSGSTTATGGPHHPFTAAASDASRLSSTHPSVPSVKRHATHHESVPSKEHGVTIAAALPKHHAAPHSQITGKGSRPPNESFAAMGSDSFSYRDDAGFCSQHTSAFPQDTQAAMENSQSSDLPEQSRNHSLTSFPSTVTNNSVTHSFISGNAAAVRARGAAATGGPVNLFKAIAARNTALMNYAAANDLHKAAEHAALARRRNKEQILANKRRVASSGTYNLCPTGPSQSSSRAVSSSFPKHRSRDQARHKKPPPPSARGEDSKARGTKGGSDPASLSFPTASAGEEENGVASFMGTGSSAQGGAAAGTAADEAGMQSLARHIGRRRQRRGDSRTSPSRGLSKTPRRHKNSYMDRAQRNRDTRKGTPRLGNLHRVEVLDGPLASPRAAAAAATAASAATFDSGPKEEELPSFWMLHIGLGHRPFQVPNAVLSDFLLFPAFALAPFGAQQAQSSAGVMPSSPSFPSFSSGSASVLHSLGAQNNASRFVKLLLRMMEGVNPGSSTVTEAESPSIASDHNAAGTGTAGRCGGPYLRFAGIPFQFVCTALDSPSTMLRDDGASGVGLGAAGRAISFTSSRATTVGTWGHPHGGKVIPYPLLLGPLPTRGAEQRPGAAGRTRPGGNVDGNDETAEISGGSSIFGLGGGGGPSPGGASADHSAVGRSPEDGRAKEKRTGNVQSAGFTPTLAVPFKTSVDEQPEDGEASTQKSDDESLSSQVLQTGFSTVQALSGTHPTIGPGRGPGTAAAAPTAGPTSVSAVPRGLGVEALRFLGAGEGSATNFSGESAPHPLIAARLRAMSRYSLDRLFQEVEPLPLEPLKGMAGNEGSTMLFRGAVDSARERRGKKSDGVLPYAAQLSYGSLCSMLSPHNIRQYTAVIKGWQEDHTTTSSVTATAIMMASAHHPGSWRMHHRPHHFPTPGAAQQLGRHQVVALPSTSNPCAVRLYTITTDMVDKTKTRLIDEFIALRRALLGRLTALWKAHELHAEKARLALHQQRGGTAGEDTQPPHLACRDSRAHSTSTLTDSKTKDMQTHATHDPNALSSRGIATKTDVAAPDDLDEVVVSDDEANLLEQRRRPSLQMLGLDLPPEKFSSFSLLSTDNIIVDLNAGNNRGAEVAGKGKVKGKDKKCGTVGKTKKKGVNHSKTPPPSSSRKAQPTTPNRLSAARQKNRNDVAAAEPSTRRLSTVTAGSTGTRVTGSRPPFGGGPTRVSQTTPRLNVTGSFTRGGRGEPRRGAGGRGGRKGSTANSSTPQTQASISSVKTARGSVSGKSGGRLTKSVATAAAACAAGAGVGVTSSQSTDGPAGTMQSFESERGQMYDRDRRGSLAGLHTPVPDGRPFPGLCLNSESFANFDGGDSTHSPQQTPFAKENNNSFAAAGSTPLFVAETPREVCVEAPADHSLPVASHPPLLHGASPGTLEANSHPIPQDTTLEQQPFAVEVSPFEALLLQVEEADLRALHLETSVGAVGDSLLRHLRVYCGLRRGQDQRSSPSTGVLSLSATPPGSPNSAAEGFPRPEEEGPSAASGLPMGADTPAESRRHSFASVHPAWNLPKVMVSSSTPGPPPQRHSSHVVPANGSFSVHPSVLNTNASSFSSLRQQPEQQSESSSLGIMVKVRRPTLSRPPSPTPLSLSLKNSPKCRGSEQHSCASSVEALATQPTRQAVLSVLASRRPSYLQQNAEADDSRRDRPRGCAALDSPLVAGSHGREERREVQQDSGSQLFMLPYLGAELFTDQRFRKSYFHPPAPPPPPPHLPPLPPMAGEAEEERSKTVKKGDDTSKTQEKMLQPTHASSRKDSLPHSLTENPHADNEEGPLSGPTPATADGEKQSSGPLADGESEPETKQKTPTRRALTPPPPPTPAAADPVYMVALSTPLVEQGNLHQVFMAWLQPSIAAIAPGMPAQERAELEVSPPAALPPSPGAPSQCEKEIVIRNVIRAVLQQLRLLHQKGVPHGGIVSSNIFCVSHVEEATRRTVRRSQPPSPPATATSQARATEQKAPTSTCRSAEEDLTARSHGDAEDPPCRSMDEPHAPPPSQRPAYLYAESFPRTLFSPPRHFPAVSPGAAEGTTGATSPSAAPSPAEGTSTASHQPPAPELSSEQQEGSALPSLTSFRFPQPSQRRPFLAAPRPTRCHRDASGLQGSQLASGTNQRSTSGHNGEQATASHSPNSKHGEANTFPKQGTSPLPRAGKTPRPVKESPPSSAVSPPQANVSPTPAGIRSVARQPDPNDAHAHAVSSSGPGQGGAAGAATPTSRLPRCTSFVEPLPGGGGEGGESWGRSHRHPSPPSRPPRLLLPDRLYWEDLVVTPPPTGTGATPLPFHIGIPTALAGPAAPQTPLSTQESFSFSPLLPPCSFPSSAGRSTPARGKLNPHFAASSEAPTCSLPPASTRPITSPYHWSQQVLLADRPHQRVEAACGMAIATELAKVLQNKINRPRANDLDAREPSTPQLHGAGYARPHSTDFILPLSALQFADGGEGISESDEKRSNPLEEPQKQAPPPLSVTTGMGDKERSSGLEPQAPVAGAWKFETSWFADLRYFPFIEAASAAIPPPEWVQSEMAWLPHGRERALLADLSESSSPFRLRYPNTTRPLGRPTLAADVWMLGMLVLELTQQVEHSSAARSLHAGSGQTAEKHPGGHLPRGSHSATSPLRASWHYQKEPLPLLTADTWSAPLRLFVGRCLRKHPEERPSVEDLLEDPWFSFDIVEEAQARVAHPPPAPTDAEAERRRRAMSLRVAVPSPSITSIGGPVGLGADVLQLLSTVGQSGSFVHSGRVPPGGTAAASVTVAIPSASPPGAFAARVAPSSSGAERSRSRVDVFFSSSFVELLLAYHDLVFREAEQRRIRRLHARALRRRELEDQLRRSRGRGRGIFFSTVQKGGEAGESDMDSMHLSGSGQQLTPGGSSSAVEDGGLDEDDEDTLEQPLTLAPAFQYLMQRCVQRTMEIAGESVSSPAALAPTESFFSALTAASQAPLVTGSDAVSGSHHQRSSGDAGIASSCVSGTTYHHDGGDACTSPVIRGLSVASATSRPRMSCSEQELPPSEQLASTTHSIDLRELSLNGGSLADATLTVATLMASTVKSLRRAPTTDSSRRAAAASSKTHHSLTAMSGATGAATLDPQQLMKEKYKSQHQRLVSVTQSQNQLSGPLSFTSSTSSLATTLHHVIPSPRGTTTSSSSLSSTDSSSTTSSASSSGSCSSSTKIATSTSTTSTSTGPHTTSSSISEDRSISETESSTSVARTPPSHKSVHSVTSTLASSMVASASSTSGSTPRVPRPTPHRSTVTAPKRHPSNAGTKRRAPHPQVRKRTAPLKKSEISPSTYMSLSSSRRNIQATPPPNGSRPARTASAATKRQEPKRVVPNASSPAAVPRSSSANPVFASVQGVRDTFQRDQLDKTQNELRASYRSVASSARRGRHSQGDSDAPVSHGAASSPRSSGTMPTGPPASPGALGGTLRSLSPAQLLRSIVMENHEAKRRLTTTKKEGRKSAMSKKNYVVSEATLLNVLGFNYFINPYDLLDDEAFDSEAQSHEVVEILDNNEECLLRSDGVDGSSSAESETESDLDATQKSHKSRSKTRKEKRNKKRHSAHHHHENLTGGVTENRDLGQDLEPRRSSAPLIQEDDSEDLLGTTLRQQHVQQLLRTQTGSARPSPSPRAGHLAESGAAPPGLHLSSASAPPCRGGRWKPSVLHTSTFKPAVFAPRDAHHHTGKMSERRSSSPLCDAVEERMTTAFMVGAFAAAVEECRSSPACHPPNAYRVHEPVKRPREGRHNSAGRRARERRTEQRPSLSPLPYHGTAQGRRADAMFREVLHWLDHPEDSSESEEDKGWPRRQAISAESDKEEEPTPTELDGAGHATAKSSTHVPPAGVRSFQARLDTFFQSFLHLTATHPEMAQLWTATLLDVMRNHEDTKDAASTFAALRPPLVDKSVVEDNDTSMSKAAPAAASSRGGMAGAECEDVCPSHIHHYELMKWSLSAAGILS